MWSQKLPGGSPQHCPSSWHPANCTLQAWQVSVGHTRNTLRYLTETATRSSAWPKHSATECPWQQGPDPLRVGAHYPAPGSWLRRENLLAAACSTAQETGNALPHWHSAIYTDAVTVDCDLRSECRAQECACMQCYSVTTGNPGITCAIRYISLPRHVIPSVYLHSCVRHSHQLS